MGAKTGAASKREEAARLALSARLRAAGVAPSRVRLAVLQALAEAPGPAASHGGEDVFRLLDRRGTLVSLSTVYRVLKEFERAGLVAQEWRRHRGSMRALFRLREPESEEGTVGLACGVCGTRVEVRDPDLFERLVRLARANGLPAVGSVSVQIDGRSPGRSGQAHGCASCLAQPLRARGAGRAAGARAAAAGVVGKPAPSRMLKLVS